LIGAAARVNVARMQAADDPRYGRFALRTDCPACGSHLPVNGPARAVDCADCGETLEVPDQLVVALLDAFEEAWPDAERAGSSTVGDITWRWTASPVEPADAAHATPVHEPPDWLRKAIASAAAVLGGDVDQRRPPGGDRPVALTCPSCGAALAITSRHHRITPCDHCGSRVHIPDAVWRALHPAHKVLPWFVRFDGESRKTRAARLRREAQDRESRSAREREEQRKADAVRLEKERAARAELDRQQRRRRLWITLPLVALVWSGALVAAGLTALFGAWLALGPNAARLAGLKPFESLLVGNGLAIAAIAVLVPTWLLGLGAARFHAGLPLLAITVWASIMVVLCAIPFAGLVFALVFALLFLRGREPTVGTEERIPLLASAPLALVYLTITAIAHLAYVGLGI
jgi:ribosomal protein S27E